MTRYIADETNLKMMMNLLRDKSKNIQFEAFHVFKVRTRICKTGDVDTLTVFRHIGFRREPQEAASDREHLAEKQGEATEVPQGLP